MDSFRDLRALWAVTIGCLIQVVALCAAEPDKVTLTGTTALYDDDGVRFKGFAAKGTAGEVSQVVSGKGIYRVKVPKQETSFLC